MAVQQFLAIRCPRELGAFNIYGPHEIVREAGFGEVDEELEEYVRGALMIGLGIRMTNDRDPDGGVGWGIQLRSDDVVRGALAVADAAARAGQWARVHTVYLSDDEEVESSGGSRLVIDVFDAPIPLDEDESPEALEAARW